MPNSKNLECEDTLLKTKQLLSGRNLIDSERGEYLGTFFNGEYFIACFDSRQLPSLDIFYLDVVKFNSQDNCSNEYTVECFGNIHGETYGVLMVLSENK